MSGSGWKGLMPAEGPMMPGLFGEDVHATSIRESAARAGRDGAHPARPGSGPKDETCGSCSHLIRIRGNSRNYLKCGRMRANWTCGPGSDVRQKDPACYLWEKGVNDG